MTTITIEQAKKIFEEINKNFKNGKFEPAKIDKFLIEFTELLNDEKFSQANTNLFSSLVGLHMQSDSKTPKLYITIFHWIEIYIDIMENPTKIDSEGAKLI